MLDLTRLRVLLAVARHGSVTAAAEALHYAQPSVSHHLARLEAETGARLVQRVGRGVRLTPAGVLLAERAEEILGRLDAAEAELESLTGLTAGRVRLAAFPSALGSFVPAAVARFTAAHPGVALTLVEAEPPEALRLLRAGEVDLALVFAYDDGPAPDGVRLTPLFDEPLHLVTRPDDAGELADFAGARWIAGCERCRQSLVRRCADAGFTPRIAYTSDDIVVEQAFVAAGLGVTTMPGMALRSHLAEGVHATELPVVRRIYLATYGDPPDPPATTAFIEALRNVTPPGPVGSTA
jgi:DNA-binding transcriptional LysR family regulator